ncbi:MAG: hypothetical protein Q8P52_01455 [bacterium]|nr:hypothetical protein [bacterium]
MHHFICTGECGGESPVPGLCQAETCSKHGESLVECSCDDGLHKHIVPDDDSTEVEDVLDEE